MKRTQWLPRTITAGLLVMVMLVVSTVFVSLTNTTDPNAITLWQPADTVKPGDALLLKGKQRFNHGQLLNLSFFIGQVGVEPQSVDPATVRLIVPSLDPGTYTVRVVKHVNNPGRDILEFFKDIQVGFPSNLDIQSGSDSITFEQGSSQNVVTIINLLTSGGIVTNIVSVSPDNGGISVISDYPSSGYSAPGPFSFVLNQSFLGNQPGKYIVTNTATLQGTNPPITASDTILVTVLQPGGDPTILPLGAYPNGVQSGVPTLITFTTSVADFNVAPEELLLRSIDNVSDPVVGVLRDNGADGDLQSNDGVYSGSILINEPSERKLVFKASGFFSGVVGEHFSDTFSLVVSDLPTKLAASNYSLVVNDAKTGESLLSNEVLVTFADGVSSARRKEIAALVNGTIVGTEPCLGVHQITIPPKNTPMGVYNAISKLSGLSEVLSATPNFVGVIANEVTPNDTSYSSSQEALRIIRGDEAWVIARGTPTIAVVDSGVNYNHEDLTGKVIKGKDHVSGDDDPIDEGDHGTHVAGIAAASSNNSKGIAGVSWNSKILAIRAIGGSYAALASGIQEAADKGAKVINISGGGKSDDAAVKKAVDNAVGKGCLVISTPANLSQVSAGTNFYPGAYSNVFCVGSTNNSDGRSSGSNYGGYVDIAAPGDNIYSALQSGGYGFKSGVSMAAPIVSGAAAVVWSRFPSWTAAKVRERLEKTAIPLPGLGLGAGRIDLFEAVFNASFEDDANGWKVTGTAGAVPNMGPINPTHRKKMGFASSGPDNAQVQTTLLQSFTIQPGVTSIPIKFDYNFVTEEYPEWVGRGFNDDMRIVLITPGGAEIELAFESVDGSTFSLVGGIDFPGGDNTVGQTGWKSVNKTVSVTSGPGTYRIVVRDRGDGIFDSNVLIDNIRFK